MSASVPLKGVSAGGRVMVLRKILPAGTQHIHTYTHTPPGLPLPHLRIRLPTQTWRVN